MSDTLHKTTQRHPQRKSITCAYCSQEFKLTGSEYKTRMRRSKTGRLYCGMWCVAQAASERESAKADANRAAKVITNSLTLTKANRGKQK